jgi:hypothetical protein
LQTKDSCDKMWVFVVLEVYLSSHCLVNCTITLVRAHQALAPQALPICRQMHPSSHVCHVYNHSYPLLQSLVAVMIYYEGWLLSFLCCVFS